jgi:hypothetical protein
MTGGLALACYGQSAKDPLEMVTGQVAAVDTAGRDDALRLLEHARTRYALRGAGRGYDLKVTITVNPGGSTQHDGVWQMEDVFDPKLGFRWTAKSQDGAVFTRISVRGMIYGEDAEPYVPLRLHEARAALFDPMPAADTVKRAAMRTSTVAHGGAALTCVLISGPGATPAAGSGRRWDETEDCIDPQTGLLRTHSQAPGRYYAYEYADGLQIGDRVMPKQVTVSEGGRVVSTITVQSLTPIRAAEASLFRPTDEMKAKGRPVALGGAQRLVHALAGTGEPVVVFGLVTASGELVEAHSLQPSNPNSAAALAAAKQMNFAHSPAPGEQPAQRFVFMISKPQMSADERR